MRRKGAFLGILFGVALLGAALSFAVAPAKAVPMAPPTASASATTATADANQPADAGRIVLVQSERRGGFFQRLFGRRDFAPPKRRDLFPDLVPPQPQAQPRRERRARATPQPAPREVKAVEKAENAKRAMVVGDFMAGALAKGLAEAYSENPNVVVIDATSGSSGLVRDDYYNWPVKLPGLIEEQKPDAILVMIGANDRQTLRGDSGPVSLGGEGWRAAYAARVAAMADVLKASGKPVFWVGLAPVQSGSMSRDYSSFNSIVREQLEAKRLRFIDVWNGFADDEGKYVAVGPNVSGQSVQLRGSDGLNFTKAGQRKLGYFVEQELNDLFGGNLPLLASASAGLSAGPSGPEIGPMVTLDAMALAGGDALSGSTPKSEMGKATEEIATRLTDEETKPPPAGRIDAYDWPLKPKLPEPEPETPPLTAR